MVQFNIHAGRGQQCFIVTILPPIKFSEKKNPNRRLRSARSAHALLSSPVLVKKQTPSISRRVVCVFLFVCLLTPSGSGRRHGVPAVPEHHAGKQPAGESGRAHPGQLAGTASSVSPRAQVRFGSVEWGGCSLITKPAYKDGLYLFLLRIKHGSLQFSGTERRVLHRNIGVCFSRL